MSFDFSNLTRRNIRYLLSRIQNEMNGGCEAPEMPDWFKETFEKQKGFTTFLHFGVSWDVDEDDPWKIVPLKKSLMAQWNQVLIDKVPVLPEVEQELKKQQERIENQEIPDEEDEDEQAPSVQLKPVRSKKAKKKSVKK